MGAIARKRFGRRIFTAAFERRPIERGPRAANGAPVGADDRKGS